MNQTQLREKYKGCKSGLDFIKRAEKCPDVQIIKGGRHPKVKVPGKGSTPVPGHRGDLPKGTWLSVARAFVRLGIKLLFPFTVLFIGLFIFVNFMV